MAQGLVSDELNICYIMCLHVTCKHIVYVDIYIYVCVFLMHMNMTCIYVKSIG